MKAHVVLRQQFSSTGPGASSSPPPPRPEKTLHNLPKTPSHKASKSPMLCPMGRFPEQPPSANELRGPRRGFVPGTNKRPRVSTVKNTHSSPPAIAREQRPSISHTKRNPTRARAMGQDYPLTRPSPGANRPIYPSFPALASRSLPEGRIPKAMKVFFGGRVLP